MIIEKPLSTSRVWLINAADFAVDFYLNGSPWPLEMNIPSISIGPEFVVDGTHARPFQTYTLQARAHGDFGGPVLAETSIELEQGTMFSAVLYDDGDGNYSLSVFDFDFSASGSSRLEVRQVSSAKFARWRTYPNNQADPRLPIDERGGGLHRGESQQATEIISNDYALEATVGGNVVARFADLEQEENKMQVLYLVGDLSPSNDPEVLASRWLQQEVRIPTAPGGKETVTKPRAAEARTQNRPIKVDFKDIEVFHTNPITVPITARDPDGFVHAIDLVRVDPPVGSARLVDTSFRASEKMGGPASVELEIGSDFPPGRYDLTMLVNAETFADWALVTKTLRVRPIDIERLRSEVERFVVADEIQTPIAEEFDALLDATEAQLREDNLFAACDLLRRFAMTASQASGASLSISAGESLEREAEAFRARLGCPGCF